MFPGAARAPDHHTPWCKIPIPMAPTDPAMDDTGKSLTLWQTTTSVLSAMFGVQSQKTRERDFAKGKATHFVIIGLIIFVAGIGA